MPDGVRANPRSVGRKPPPTTVPKIPPAAAPMTALFTLRPVTPPMIAPAAAPMPALCARFGYRRDVRDAGVGAGCSTVGSRLGVISTSPAATVLAAVSAATGALPGPGSDDAGASATRPVLALATRVLRFADALGADGVTGVDLVATRRTDAGSVRDTLVALVVAATAGD